MKCLNWGQRYGKHKYSKFTKFLSSPPGSIYTIARCLILIYYVHECPFKLHRIEGKYVRISNSTYFTNKSIGLIWAFKYCFNISTQETQQRFSQSSKQRVVGYCHSNIS